METQNENPQPTPEIITRRYIKAAKTAEQIKAGNLNATPTLRAQYQSQIKLILLQSREVLGERESCYLILDILKTMISILGRGEE